MCELCAEIQERDIYEEEYGEKIIGHVSGGILEPPAVREWLYCYRCGKRVMRMQDENGKRLLVAHDGTTHC